MNRNIKVSPRAIKISKNKGKQNTHDNEIVGDPMTRQILNNTEHRGNKPATQNTDIITVPPDPRVIMTNVMYVF